jgi:hypothetical protein
VVRHHQTQAHKRRGQGRGRGGRRRLNTSLGISDSDSSDDEDQPVGPEEMHERRLVRKHLSRMLGGRELGPAPMERTEQFVTRWLAQHGEDPVIAALYERAEERSSRSRVKARLRMRSEGGGSDDSSDDFDEDASQAEHIATVQQRALAQALRTAQLEQRLHAEEVARQSAEQERDRALEHLTALKIRRQWELSKGIVTGPQPGGSDGLGPGIKLGAGSPSLLEAGLGLGLGLRLRLRLRLRCLLRQFTPGEPEPEEVSTSGAVPPTLAATIAPVPSVVQRPPQIEVQTAGLGSGTESETEGDDVATDDSYSDSDSESGARGEDNSAM